MHVVIYPAVLLAMDLWFFQFAVIINNATLNTLRLITLLMCVVGSILGIPRRGISESNSGNLYVE